jgi:hypothetical protein
MRLQALNLVLVFPLIAYTQDDRILPATKPSESPTSTAKHTFGSTRVFIQSKHVQERAQMAGELGKPIMWWTFWPDRSDDTDNTITSDDANNFLQAFPEAEHLIASEHIVGQGEGPRVIFRHRDGGWRWIPATKVNPSAAGKVRVAWVGETKPTESAAASDPWKGESGIDMRSSKAVGGLSDVEKQSVLDMPILYEAAEDGRTVKTTIRKYVASGFHISHPISVEQCRAGGLTDVQTSYLQSLGTGGGSSVRTIQASAPPTGYGGGSPRLRVSQPSIQSQLGGGFRAAPARGGG